MIQVHRTQRYKFLQLLAASLLIETINCPTSSKMEIFVLKNVRKYVKCAIIIRINFSVSFAVVARSTSKYSYMFMLLLQWLIGEQFHETGTSGTELSTITINTTVTTTKINNNNNNNNNYYYYYYYY
jgi:hypothetical protein